MSTLERTISLLAREVSALRAQLVDLASVRQGKVTAVAYGPPVTCTVQVGEAIYPDVRCLHGYTPTVDDAPWLVSLGSGRRFALGPLGDTPWHTVGSGGSEPGFQNSWVAAAGHALRFRRDRDRVWITGRVNTGAAESVVFTLPAGFRPATQLLMPVVVSGGVGYVQVETTGTVTVGTLTGAPSSGTHLHVVFHTS